MQHRSIKKNLQTLYEPHFLLDSRFSEMSWLSVYLCLWWNRHMRKICVLQWEEIKAKNPGAKHHSCVRGLSSSFLVYFLAWHHISFLKAQDHVQYISVFQNIWSRNLMNLLKKLIAFWPWKEMNWSQIIQNCKDSTNENSVYS